MNRLLIVITLFFASGCASVVKDESNAGQDLIVGKWSFSYRGCEEIYEFKKDGTTEVVSKLEKSKSIYSVDEVDGNENVFIFTDEIVDSNLQESCHGNPTPIGSKINYYIQFIDNGEAMGLCYNEELDSCFMFFTKQ